MSMSAPQAMLDQWLDAFNSGNLEAILTFYERGATMVPQPGQQASGIPGIRQALRAFLALKPRSMPKKHSWVIAGDIALGCKRWTLTGTGPDGKPVVMSGTISDVFRRQRDGRWLVVLDNPWGTAIAE